jgi:hypothetical protein
MWFLVWFMFTNNKVEYYQLAQVPTEAECNEALKESKVLITNSTTVVYCFEVVPE